MADLNLAKEVATFNKLLPALRETYGASWVVIVGDDCRGGFPAFENAAEFAVKNFPDVEFLIRHTDAAEPQIPFALVEA
ncbi:MAG: hypothetical protein WDM92_16355 [Caulobacteraceae bacterium]